MRGCQLFFVKNYLTVGLIYLAQPTAKPLIFNLKPLIWLILLMNDKIYNIFFVKTTHCYTKYYFFNDTNKMIQIK